MKLQIEGLTKIYGQHKAVDNLSIDIDEGKILVLLGPSGCGKTTTLRCVAGFEKPDAGKITIGENVVVDTEHQIFIPPERRKLGMVFQSYAIWPHMTVHENVAFGLHLQKWPKRQINERVAEVLEIVGLKDFGSRPAPMLSGGQMQRVALARSLAPRPKLLLLDEPLSNLDLKLRDHLRFELREIQLKTKITSVYVTHDQTEAVALADKIALMKDGIIVQLGSAEEIYNNPRNSFVADFIGSSNMIPAMLMRKTDQFYETETQDKSKILCAAHNEQVKVGEKVYIVLRQENMLLSREQGDGRYNCWPAEVVVHNYLGNATRYIVSVFGQKLFVLLPGSRREFEAGEKVYLIAQPHNVSCLEE